MRRPLLVVLLILLALIFNTCCLCATFAPGVFFAHSDGPHAAIQAKSVYIALARQDASNAGIPPNLFVRQIDLESGFNPQAVSPSGAEGIAQFMPITAASLGINPWDPIAALKGAAYLMARYSKLYVGDYAKALAAYNAGPAALRSALTKCGSATWMSCLPAETRHYVQLVLQ